MEIAGAGGWLFVLGSRISQGQTLSSAAHPERAAAVPHCYGMQASTVPEPGTMVFRQPVERTIVCAALLPRVYTERTVSAAGCPGGAAPPAFQAVAGQTPTRDRGDCCVEAMV